jgi:hypothetical protein
MRMRRLILALGAIAALAGAAAAAPPAGYAPLPPQDYAFDLNGKTGNIRFEPALRITAGAGSVRVDLYVEADLTQIQKVVAAAVAGQGSYDECGERVSVSRVSLTPDGDAALLKTTVHYERWQCVKVGLPGVVPGLPSALKARPAARTRLLSQTTRICIRLRPSVSEDGSRIVLQQEVTCSQTSTGGLLGSVGALVGLDDIFRQRVRQEAEAALNRIPLVIPEEVRRVAPKFDKVRFYDRGKGVLGFIGEGSSETGLASLPLLSPFR